MNTTTRTIHTHFYSAKAYEILSAVIGQMSDGLWENSRAMEKYWPFIDVKRSIDGETVLAVNGDLRDYETNHRNGFYGLDESKILSFLADKIKAVAKAEMKNEELGNCWKRDSSAKCNYLAYDEDITFAEVYFVYEALKGRDSAEKYQAELAIGITGAPKAESEIAAAEAKRAKREEINSLYRAAEAELKAKFEADLKALKAKHVEDLKTVA